MSGFAGDGVGLGFLDPTRTTRVPVSNIAPFHQELRSPEKGKRLTRYPLTLNQFRILGWRLGVAD